MHIIFFRGEPWLSKKVQKNVLIADIIMRSILKGILALGVCSNQNDKVIEDKHSCCENFSGNFSRFRMSKKMVMRKLSEMSESMQAIRQIMEEEYRDK